MADPHDSTPTQPSPFDLLGGESAVRALVDRFYDLMDLEPAYATLRAMHPTALDGSRDKLFWFLCGWLGGPDHYIERFGHPRLRMRHMPFAIDMAGRDRWVQFMEKAMVDAAIPDECAAVLRTFFQHMATFMINRG